MSVSPYPIQCRRDGKWTAVQTDELLPGDIVSIGKFLQGYLYTLIEYHAVRTRDEASVPADLLLLRGTCIVNEAMLSGESTPLLKENIELREKDERLEVDGTTKGAILFGGTKVLQATAGGMFRCSHRFLLVYLSSIKEIPLTMVPSPWSCVPVSALLKANSCEP